MYWILNPILRSLLLFGIDEWIVHPWWNDASPALREHKVFLLSSRVIAGTKKQAKGKSVEKLSKIRDEYLVNLQKLRKKYEDKIRKW